MIELLVPQRITLAAYQYPQDRSAAARLRLSRQIAAECRTYIFEFMEPMLNGQLMGNAIEISSRQLPHYYQLAKKAAEILNIPIPKIYMRQDPYLNAMTYGNGSQSLIVLSHSLLDQLDDSMLMFILGHEMGHIAADHAHGDISPQFWDLGMHW